MIQLYKSWRTEPSGLVVVTLADGSEKTPTLVKPEHIAVVRRIQTRATYRGKLFELGTISQKVADKWGLPVTWLRSMIYQESGGNPYARNPERLPGPEDDGVGLAQITNQWLKRGFTDAELEDPETNLTICSRHITQSLVPSYGWDFPKISAAFNAGSVHKPYPGHENAWNMHCTLGHIDSEVAALNWQILDALDAATSRAVAAQFSTLELLGPEHPAVEPESPAIVIDVDDSPPTPRNS